MTRLIQAPLLLVALLHGCGPSFTATTRVVRQGGIAFRVGPLPADWNRISDDERVVFHHAEGGTISASVTCNGGADAPLDVLTEHLLFGVELRRTVARSSLLLDGRAGLDSRIEGRLDGVPIAVDLVVLKKDGCVLDLQLAGSPTAVLRSAPAFAAFWQGLHLMASR